MDNRSCGGGGSSARAENADYEENRLTDLVYNYLVISEDELCVLCRELRSSALFIIIFLINTFVIFYFIFNPYCKAMSTNSTLAVGRSSL